MRCPFQPALWSLSYWISDVALLKLFKCRFQYFTELSKNSFSLCDLRLHCNNEGEWTRNICLSMHCGGQVLIFWKWVFSSHHVGSGDKTSKRQVPLPPSHFMRSFPLLSFCLLLFLKVCLWVVLCFVLFLEIGSQASPGWPEYKTVLSVSLLSSEL